MYVDIMNRLKNGVKEMELESEEYDLILQMKKYGLVYEIRPWKESWFKLVKNLEITKDKKGDYTIVKYPNRFIGIAFDYDDLFACENEDLDEVNRYYVAYCINPSEQEVKKFNLGDEVRVKAISRGYNENNEGILVKLPRGEEEFFNLGKNPCITVGLSEEGKSKDTRSLNFDKELNGKFLTGRRALFYEDKIYYDYNKLEDVMKEKYFIESRNSYTVKKLEGEKLYPVKK